MTESLEILLQNASDRTMSDTERAEQRESFAYGNTKIENDRITREMVRSEAMNVDRRLIKE